MDKIEELKKLKTLLDQGAITEEEFQIMKKDLIHNENKTQKTSSQNTIEVEKEVIKKATSDTIKPNPSSNKSIKKKPPIKNSKSSKSKGIFLRAYKDSKKNLFAPPELEFCNINELSDGELDLLKSFLRLKQINAPDEFTKDELEIGNNLFSQKEINKINSERKGMNYLKELALCIIMACGSIFFLFLSPCFIIFGSGLAFLASMVWAISILLKGDATKLDKIFCYVVLGLGITALIVYFTGFQEMYA